MQQEELDAILAGIDALEAGPTIPLDEADRRVRQEWGFRPRKQCAAPSFSQSPPSTIFVATPVGGRRIATKGKPNAGATVFWWSWKRSLQMPSVVGLARENPKFDYELR